MTILDDFIEKNELTPEKRGIVRVTLSDGDVRFMLSGNNRSKIHPNFPKDIGKVRYVVGYFKGKKGNYIGIDPFIPEISSLGGGIIASPFIMSVDTKRLILFEILEKGEPENKNTPVVIETYFPSGARYEHFELTQSTNPKNIEDKIIQSSKNFNIYQSPNKMRSITGHLIGIDPISKEVILNPVKTKDGFSWTQSIIRHDKSNVTNVYGKVKDYYNVTMIN